jgi:hypothetical protein
MRIRPQSSRQGTKQQLDLLKTVKVPISLGIVPVTLLLRSDNSAVE